MYKFVPMAPARRVETRDLDTKVHASPRSMIFGQPALSKSTCHTRQVGRRGQKKEKRRKETRFVRVEQYIVGLEVAVLHPQPVHVRERRSDLPRPLRGLSLALPLAGSERTGHLLEAL